MKIRYKISILMILLTVVIILLINFSYVKIVTWAVDDFITRYLPPQITSAFLDVPSEDYVDWEDMQMQIDRALEEFDDFSPGLSPPISFDAFQRAGVRGAHVLRVDLAGGRLDSEKRWVAID